MSNTQAPNGFSVLSRYDGAAPNYPFVYRQIASSNTTVIGFGDPVEDLGNGYIDLAAGATTTIYGIFIGCEYVDSSIGKRWSLSWPGVTTGVSGTIQAHIINDPSAQFLVQAGGATPIVNFTDIGANATFGGAGAPNAAGISTAYLDASTVNTTNTLAFRIMGFGQRPDNDVTSNYNWAVVKMNNQVFNTTTGLA